MSMTKTGSPLGVTRLRAPLKDRRASVSPLITSGSTPSRSLMPAKRAVTVLDIASSRGCHEVHVLDRHIGFLDQFRVLVDCCERTLQGGGMELTSGVDGLAEPYHLKPSLQILQTTCAVGFGDQQTNGIRSAIDGGNPRHQALLQAWANPERAQVPVLPHHRAG